jgi:hypothetical protein
MGKQLYRFQIQREVSSSVSAAIDEADESNVWLVEVALRPDRYEEDLKELEKIADNQRCESFTADGKFYCVAASQIQAKELLATIAAKGFELSVAEAESPGEIQEPTPWHKSKVVIGILASALILTVFVAIGVAIKPHPKAAIPVLAPAGGNFQTSQTVALYDPTPGAIIHYTLDGSPPADSSPVYTEPFTGLHSGTKVRAIATAQGYTQSPEVMGVYQWNSSVPKIQSGNLPLLYNEGKDFYNRKLYAQARNSFAQACNGGEMDACNYLGYLYAEGLGGHPDVGKAHELYQQACERDTFRSCASLGSLYQNAGNDVAARKYFQKACNGGFAEACVLLRRLQ